MSVALPFTVLTMSNFWRQVYSDSGATNKSCKEWFRCFNNGDCKLEDHLFSGQAKNEDKEFEKYPWKLC